MVVIFLYTYIAIPADSQFTFQGKYFVKNKFSLQCYSPIGIVALFLNNLAPAAILKQYYPLLRRYATKLIHDPVEAEKIVRQVFEDHYNIGGLAPSNRLRKLL